MEGNRDSELAPGKRALTLSEVLKRTRPQPVIGIFSCSKVADLVHLKDEDEIGGLIEKISEKLTLLYGKLLSYISTTYHRREITCFILKLVHFARDLLSFEAVMDAVLLRMVYPTAWKHEWP